MIPSHFSKTDDSFKIYVTIDFGADSNKISGTEVQNIFYDQAKLYRTLGEHTIDVKEFSLTNLEGKLGFNHQWLGDVIIHLLLCSFLFYPFEYFLLFSYFSINLALFET